MKYTYILKGLDCANCASKIEERLTKVKDIDEVSVNFITNKLIFTCDSNLFDEKILEIKKIINKLEPDIQLDIYI